MKFFKYLFAVLFFSQTAVFANLNDVVIGNIEYDWINKDDVAKESIISEVHDILFENDVKKIKGFKKELKGKTKDKKHWDNYIAASSGYKEYNGKNISAFYFKNQKHIYMYALQDKKDLSKIYYYDALGHLKYVDNVCGEYPDYPYSAYQYNTSGKLISAIYYASKDTQYLFTPKEDFKGVWYKHNLYDRDSKVILTRTTY